MAFDSSHWKWNTVFSVPTTDEMILAQGCVSLISATSILVILLFCVAYFRDDYTLPPTKPIRYSCIISIILFFIHSLLQLTTLSNAFIPLSTLQCQIFYTSQLMAYNLAKISMFWLFSYRLQLLCNSGNFSSKLPISRILLTLYRVSYLIIPTLLWIVWIYLAFNDIRPHNTVTTDNEYQYCFPQKFTDLVISENIIRAGLVVTDFIFIVLALIAFVTKCCQIAIFVSDHSFNHNENSKNYNNVTNAENMLIMMKKYTFLATLAMVSTMFYTFGDSYILKQIGFFLCFDGVINSLSIACLFRCGDGLYDFIFSRMETILFWMFYILSCCFCACCRCGYGDNDDEYRYIDVLPVVPTKHDVKGKRSLIYNAEDINPYMGLPTVSDLNTEDLPSLPLKI